MPQFSSAFWKENMYCIYKCNSVPPAMHSGVKEISSRANSAGSLHHTSASKATLKGLLLERTTLAYIHLFSSFLLEDQKRISIPWSPTVYTCWQWSPRVATESALRKRGVQLARVTQPKPRSAATCLGSTGPLRYGSNPWLLVVTKCFWILLLILVQLQIKSYYENKIK